MKISKLSIHQFRNLRSDEISLVERSTVFFGSNGEGKTNLLEALYFSITQRPFRASRLRDLIRFDCNQAVLKTTFEHHNIQSELKITLVDNKKQLFLDEKKIEPKGLNQHLNGLAVVLFTPDDLQIPKGSPTQRRQLVDRAIAAIWNNYIYLVRDYIKTLRNRNHLLKKNASKDMIDVFDRQLATYGAKIILTRKRYLSSIKERLTTSFARIMSNHHLELKYQTQASGQTIEELSSSLYGLFVENRAKALAIKRTLIGPHTDDIYFEIDGKNAREFASQGQLRSLVLSFKISQILDTYDKIGHYPILLLDDVSSELDAERNSYLFNFINEITCQVILTTTRPELIPLDKNRKDYNILKGVITHL